MSFSAMAVERCEKECVLESVEHELNLQPLNGDIDNFDEIREIRCQQQSDDFIDRMLEVRGDYDVQLQVSEFSFSDLYPYVEISAVKKKKRSRLSLSLAKVEKSLKRKKTSCHDEGCSRRAQSGGFCVSHGGGPRCSAENCSYGAKSGGFCISHGGGPRCSAKNCSYGAKSGGFCVSHGGGPRCSAENCPYGAKKSGFCVVHDKMYRAVL